MPVVAVSVKKMNELLGKKYDMNTLVYSLEQLGCDVEDTAEMGLFKCPACQTPNDRLIHEEPPKRCDYCGYESEEPFEQFETSEVIRIDLLADRPDLFDTGGLSRALKGYLGIEKGLAEFKVYESRIEVEVDPVLSEKETYRPYISCAVVTVPPLDQNGLREIMRLQENLHWGIGRDRKLASIGVYDMEVINPPIQYAVVDPVRFEFCPLGMPGKKMTPKQILEEHPKGKTYAHLMEPYKKYPILMDAKDLVLAMPPIINSDETKCKVGTSRIFIDVTGINKEAVVNSLNTLVSALIELKGRVEFVNMNYQTGTENTPDLSPQKITLDYREAQRWLGIEFTSKEFMEHLRKMRLNVEKKENEYEVSYPVYRTDIRHQVDVFEDLAIGYGYDRIQTKTIPTLTIGEARREELLSNMVRDIMIGHGFTEIMSLHLQSVERHFSKFEIKPEGKHVRVENPKTKDQEIMRTHLMTGIMETFYKNRRKSVPQKIFEVGNVVVINKKMETGVNEYKHLAFGIIGPETGYAEARMYLDSLLREMGLKGKYKPDSHPSFCEGRYALVECGGDVWAKVGEIHPQVLNNFGLVYPVSYCELCFVKVI
ncbi:MAG: phenylalanine--tRNA ligase subunit beta [Candidatus Aminicenantaceae bacterium]